MEDKNYQFKHKWTLWFHDVKDTNWDESSYQKLYIIHGTKDFSEILNTIPTFTAGMFFLMKDDIFPRWEDIHNISGGYWSFRVTKKHCDKIWKNLMAALIGETLMKEMQNMDEVTGISVSPKINNCILKIWNKNSKKSSVRMINEKIEGINIKEALYKGHHNQLDLNHK